MTTTHAMTVGTIDLTVQVFDARRTTEGVKIVSSIALPLAAWPVTAAEIEQRANATFLKFKCRPTRGDAVWAVNKSGDEYMSESDHFFWRAAPTEAEARAIHRAARDEAEDGLV